MANRTRVENGTEEQVQPRPAAPPDEAREPWPEETEQPSKAAQAKSYLREHPKARWALLLILIIVIVGGLYAWRYYSTRETTDDAQIDGHIVPVSARVGGTVVRVDVRDNQYVDKGQLLVQLDPTDYEVALARAKADLANAEASAAAAHVGVPIATTTTTSNVNVAEASLQAARKEVDAAKARVGQAQAAYAKAASDLKRMQMLVEKDEVSRQQYDAAVSAEQAARAALDGAQASVAAAESHVAQAQAQVNSAKTAPQQVQVTRSKAEEAAAAVQRSQAAVQQAQLNLDYTTVRAAFAGVISKRSVEPGQVVQAGQPLFALIDLDDVYVTANFKETQLEHMCPGQSATIHVDAYNRDFKGLVDSLSGATGARFSLLPPENATGNYVKVVQRVPVKLTFAPGENKNHQLRPGMSVEPTVMVNQPCAHSFGEATPAAPQPQSK